jgi:3-oxoacyl-[acyl-carrier protein] reductase
MTESRPGPTEGLMAEGKGQMAEGKGQPGDQKDLGGRVAIVTGSSRNIGRAIALELAGAGASVIVNGRTAAVEAETVADEIRKAGGRAAVKLADVADPQGAAALIAAAVESFGRLDILVNNAAVRREVEFAQLDYREWREIVSVILDAAYLCSHAALPHLVASGSGVVINIGGVSAHTGASRRAHVVAAKAGLAGLTRALAHDLAPHGITVNCVVPGFIETRRAGGVPTGHAAARPLAGRLGRPEEIAALVRFLCGPEGRYITGQSIHANGGVFMA